MIGLVLLVVSVTTGVFYFRHANKEILSGILCIITASTLVGGIAYFLTQGI